MTLRPLFINGRFLTQEITGTQRYAHEIIDWLDAKLVESGAGWPEVAILVPSSDKLLPTYKAIQLKVVGACSGRLWEQVELPFYSRGGVLFTPCGGAPLIHPRSVVTIHDAGVFAIPGAYSFLFRLWYQFLYRAHCHTSLHVLTVSYASKYDLERYSGADPDKLSVTYLGAEHATRTTGLSGILEKYNLKRLGYVLIVGSRSPNKNLKGLLDAMALLGDGLRLVVVGKENESVFGKRRTLKLPSHVLGLEHVSEAELHDLYGNAACFVFPSFYEGFGLPPLEAMAVGCPVVTSNTSALAELFSTIAFVCDPEDPQDIAARIAEACLAGPEYRQSCRDFTSLFQWERCAKRTWELVAPYCMDEAGRGAAVRDLAWQSLTQSSTR
ncbi:MAG TPA: glycosyltransferase family 1 protein [Acidisarcina sp.]